MTCASIPMWRGLPFSWHWQRVHCSAAFRWWVFQSEGFTMFCATAKGLVLPPRLVRCDKRWSWHRSDLLLRCWWATGLLLASFRELLKVNPGYRTDNVVTASVSAPSNKYNDSQLETL